MHHYQDICIEHGDIVVRPLKPEDYPIWKQGFDDQERAQNRFDEGWFDTKELDEAWFNQKCEERETLASLDERYLFHVFHRESQKALGYCDITTHQRDEFQYGRIGYAIFNPYWNQGYGTQCIEAVLTIGFAMLDFHRLEAHINLDNEPSKRVASKAGMRFECVRERFIYENEEWVEHAIYVIIALIPLSLKGVKYREVSAGIAFDNPCVLAIMFLRIDLIGGTCYESNDFYQFTREGFTEKHDLFSGNGLGF
ncbi:MAG: GNAT family N-acetyltransferase [Erysipelotrichaceae bacterium]